MLKKLVVFSVPHQTTPFELLFSHFLASDPSSYLFYVQVFGFAVESLCQLAIAILLQIPSPNRLLLVTLLKVRFLNQVRHVILLEVK